MVAITETFLNGGFPPKFVSKLPKTPVASAISGLIVAALILMTPNPWFEAFIAESGLPGLIAAAEPPLGARARIVFALIAALTVTITAWGALTIILNRQKGGRDDFDFADPDYEAPAMRRRRVDAHPDDPARAPILAGQDLGIPMDLVDVAGAEEVADDAAAEDLWAETDAAFEADAFGFEDGSDPIDAPAGDPFDPDVTIVPELPEESGAEATVSEEPAIESAPEPSAPEQPVFTIPLRSRAVETDPGQAKASPEPAAGAAREPDLAELIVRLEAGLDQRRNRYQRQREKRDNAQRIDAAPEARTAPHPVSQTPDPAGQDMDSALREALDALQKLSAKGA